MLLYLFLQYRIDKGVKEAGMIPILQVKICDKSKYPGIYQKAVDSAALYKSKTGISMLLPNPNTFCLPCERLSQLQLRLPAPEKHRISKLKMMVDLAAA